jgi:hypothetical protein
MNNESKTLMTRYYVMKASTGYYILKVDGHDVEGFLELFGDMIHACGESREEAMEDFANRKLSPGKQSWWEWMKEQAARTGFWG